MTRERIEELMATKPWTKEMKAEIREAADALGLKYIIREGARCRECYDKLLVRIYEATEVGAAVSLDGWRLKDPRHSFRTFGGELWSNATIAGKEVGNLHQNIIDAYFEKVGEDGE